MSELIQVSKSIWCVRRRSYFVCSYIVKSGNGVVLIDAGMSSDGLEMLKAVEAIGFGAQNIKGILLTHWHNDHAAGASAISKIANAPVYYHQADASNFNGLAARPGIFSKMGDLIPEVGFLVLFKGLIRNTLPNPVLAQRFIHDGDILLEDFEVMETPGHTPGHVCFYYRPEKTLFAGDALAVVGKQLRFMARVVTPDKIGARESMRRCMNKDIEIVCPGHRSQLSKGISEEKKIFQEKLDINFWPLLG